MYKLMFIKEWILNYIKLVGVKYLVYLVLV